MSKEFEDGRPEAEIEANRLQTAQWIYDNLRPVEHVMSKGYTDVRSTFETRDYQLDAWASLWDARQEGAKSGLIPLATGLGKTSVGVFDVMKYREEYTGPRKGGPKVLFTSHQDEINQQAAERFAQFIPDMSQGFFSRHKKEQGADVTFATLQSLYRNLDQFNPRYFDYIIYDEAHHLKADTFERVVNHFKPRFQLALTATPDRMDGLDIRKLFGEPLYSKNLADALAEGLLVDVDYHIVFDDAVKEAIQSDFNPETLKELRGLLGVQPRNEVIAKNVKEEMHKIGLDKAKTIIFCDDIEHAKDIATLVGGEAYHSGIKSKKERRDVMDRFKYGDLQIICTRDMFNEGVDIPDARLIVFLRTTSSATVFEQQLGRGLRPALGKTKVTILDFAANIERIEQVRGLAETVMKRNDTDRDYAVESYPERASRSNAFHSEHTDFDFDKLAVDLLEKFYSLKRDRNPLLDLNNDQLIELALNIKSGSRLAYKEMQELAKEGKFVSMQTIVRRFGSIVEFHKACGFEVKEIAKLSNEELVNLALELSPSEPL